MHIFVNDTLINLLKPEEHPNPERFNFILESGKDKLTRANLIHHVWLKNGTTQDLDTLLEIIEPRVFRQVLSITITTEQYDEVKRHFKSKFKVIKAAGGIVKKGQRILMILRLKKWDLPKGKIEKNEAPADAAVREIYEECGVKAKVKGKVCNTWHTYTMKKRKILKKTTWYSMTCKDDTEMSPQIEEDIEEVRWMNPKEAYHAMENSYRSIQYVMDMWGKG